MAVLQHTRLTCTSGSSNKEYNIYITKSGGDIYEVFTEYGAIGSRQLRGKTELAPSLSQATSSASRMVQEKLRKGYVVDRVSPRIVGQPSREIFTAQSTTTASNTSGLEYEMSTVGTSATPRRSRVTVYNAYEETPLYQAEERRRRRQAPEESSPPTPPQRSEDYGRRITL